MAKSRKIITDLTMEKPYLSIGEVAAKFDVSVDLLRKWEKEFPRYIHPRRNSGGDRLYDSHEVQRIAVVYRLIRIEGLSIEGARRRIKEGDTANLESRQEVIQRLQRLRTRLLGIVEELDKTTNNRSIR